MFASGYDEEAQVQGHPLSANLRRLLGGHVHRCGYRFHHRCEVDQICGSELHPAFMCHTLPV